MGKGFCNVMYTVEVLLSESFPNDYLYESLIKLSYYGVFKRILAVSYIGYKWHQTRTETRLVVWKQPFSESETIKMH